MDTDGELIRMSRRQPEAFVGIFERHFDSIYGYLARRVGRDLGADLASETFTRAFEGRRRYDVTRSDARPWLFGIAANILRRHLREEERQLRALARAPDRPADEDAGSDARLAAALAVLSTEERDALLLLAWAELTYEEIAAVVQAPVGTVRSRLNRARTHVREALLELEALDG